MGHSKTKRPPGSITNLGNPQKSYQSQYAHMILSLRRFRVHEAAIVGCLDCHKSASFDASEIKRVLADEVPGWRGAIEDRGREWGPERGCPSNHHLERRGASA